MRASSGYIAENFGPRVYEERNDDLDVTGYAEFMEFRLTYQGKLPGSGNTARHTSEKHLIRKEIHKQLAELWAIEPLFRRLKKRLVEKDFLERFARPRHGFDFFPLIRENWQQACTLDILLLRREKPGNLISQGGDIDNRVKTLFDALSMPQSEAGLTPPEPHEQPFHCLLENDGLITTVKVTADRLLTPTATDEPRNYVHAIINVTLMVTMDVGWGPFNAPFVAHPELRAASNKLLVL